jgi:hypothetical protein
MQGTTPQSPTYLAFQASDHITLSSQKSKYQHKKWLKYLIAGTLLLAIATGILIAVMKFSVRDSSKKITCSRLRKLFIIKFR